MFSVLNCLVEISQGPGKGREDNARSMTKLKELFGLGAGIPNYLRHLTGDRDIRNKRQALVVLQSI
jgi:hypothetical protein